MSETRRPAALVIPVWRALVSGLLTYTSLDPRSLACMPPSGAATKALGWLAERAGLGTGFRPKVDWGNKGDRESSRNHARESPRQTLPGALRFHFTTLNCRILLAVFEPSLLYSMPSLVAQMVPM